jgi:hypothetical protein
VSTEGTSQVPDSPRRPDPRLMPRKSVLVARPVGVERDADAAPAESPVPES